MNGHDPGIEEDARILHNEAGLQRVSLICAGSRKSCQTHRTRPLSWRDRGSSTPGSPWVAASVQRSWC